MGVAEETVVISFHVTRWMLEEMDRLVKEGRYPSRAEVVRVAVAELLRKLKMRSDGGGDCPGGDENVTWRVVSDNERVIKSALELAERINRAGIIDREELYAFLEEHGIVGPSSRRKFLRILAEELGQKNLRLVVTNRDLARMMDDNH